MSIIQEIINNHHLRWENAQQTLENDFYKGKRAIGLSNSNADLRLFTKWAYRVEKNWYGFSLGEIPAVWVDIISDFLEWIEKLCPDFKILQIKIKMGGLRFYIDKHSENNIISRTVDKEIHELEKVLFHQNLIY